jgi:hypothetical protein
VFEIGNSLREARLRQGLEIPRIEGDTKIRGKYLRALEDEGFDALPGDTYVKGFLRTYADYLGLDGQLYVDEYNSRFSRSDEPPPAPAASRRKLPGRTESNLVVVALAGIAAVTVLVVVGLAGIGSDSPEKQAPLLGLTGAETTDANEGEDAGAAAEDDGDAGDPGAAAGDERPNARLVLTAARGSSWLQVRAGGVNGRLLYEGTLEEGQTQRFAGHRRLWLDLEAPGNLDARLNGRDVEDLPGRAAVVVVNARGVRILSTG